MRASWKYFSRGPQKPQLRAEKDGCNDLKGKLQLVGGSELGRAAPALTAGLCGIGTSGFVSPGENVFGILRFCNLSVLSFKGRALFLFHFHHNQGDWRGWEFSQSRGPSVSRSSRVGQLCVQSPGRSSVPTWHWAPSPATGALWGPTAASPGAQCLRRTPELCTPSSVEFPKGLKCSGGWFVGLQGSSSLQPSHSVGVVMVDCSSGNAWGCPHGVTWESWNALGWKGP